MKLPQHLSARLLLFLACLPSGGAVLAEVYGVASLHDVVWFAAVPGYLILVGAEFYARRAGNAWLADALVIGSLGGFVGTIGYDVMRIPFVLAGQNVYMPNSTYGLWILDAAASSRFTETAGWIRARSVRLMFLPCVAARRESAPAGGSLFLRGQKK